MIPYGSHNIIWEYQVNSGTDDFMLTSPSHTHAHTHTCTHTYMHTHIHTHTQLFLRDAEQIDGTTGSQEAYLSNDDLGVSVVAMQ